MKDYVIKGYGIPLEKNNVDTDQIIPARFCYTGKSSGYGNALFGNWRQDPSFIINKEKYKNASILIVGEAFATGSSREFAVWALKDYGVKIIIGKSFGGIFIKNAIINDLLVLETNYETIDYMYKTLKGFSKTLIEIDLFRNELHVNSKTFPISIDERYKRKYLIDINEIDLTLNSVNKINKFETENYPYLIRKRLKGL